ncbi:hypothetical protein CC1G_07731 [Coprinopsis cinerea okayama7|uniref:DUF7137 domain-containing protein n=1 Tax=Coprinopsis cinerea (strain Okayama-7 / 130 / ATCC MYA-4618 / FGSC 9003) TaxID=240176 RepID=A8NBY4_COPC7|nr:hypothetical protein CC1G_07731 [Coprinopsis cinerea okayama7\|eukprot:XP_001832344.2 hypothetical protein CC1G_07731 [Coprinopsis cinerea okayama7\
MSDSIDNTNDNGNSPPEIPPTAPAGILVWTQPPIATSTSYLKLAPNKLVTFGWNFSYVLATPTQLSVSAACSGGNTYPVDVIPGTATQVVWDMYGYQSEHPELPLPQAVCTLLVQPDDRTFGSRDGGYLSPNNELRVAIYKPQPYTPLADGWSCVDCSNAGRFVPHPAAESIF